LKQTMSSSRPNQPGKSGAAASSSSSSKSTKTVAKRGAAGPAAGRGRGLPTDGQGNLIPGRYQLPGGELRVNKIQRAEQYNVLAVAKAMNGAELAPKVKQLFEPEMRAVEEAKASGWYFSWRPREPPYDKQDCQRVHSGSRCFCGHNLAEHKQPGGRALQLPCQHCKCANFEWVPTRPEEAGEFWLKRRRDFDPASWRAKCRCKHTHEEHRSDTRQHQCRSCPCGAFNSVFVCAACDQSWEKHETVFETERERLDAGRPVGDDWIPFAEMEEVRTMVLHGRDDGPSGAAALPDPANPGQPGEEAVAAAVASGPPTTD
ncbi:hypothetical protein BOX15_Mlig019563g1, partial [Macrostomum lignano]